MIHLEQEHSLFDHTYNLVIVGSQQSGKSALLHRYINDSFPSQYQQTLGADLFTKNIVENDIWSLAGHPMYRFYLKQFFSLDVSIILVAVDLTCLSSLDDATYWLEQAKSCCPTADCFVVGLKADLVDQFVFKFADLSQLASNHGAIGFYPVSSKSNTGVSDLFTHICTHLKKT